MRFKPTYMALAVLAGFGLALGACSSSSDDDAPPATDMTDMEPEPDPGPTELQMAQSAAADAAADAKTASDAATKSYEDAKASVANAATMQTGDTHTAALAGVKAQAAAAAAAYAAAKKASEDAAAATTVTAAVLAQGDAEDAQAAAEAAQEKAAEYAADVDLASVLMIDDTMKSVGETTIDANAPNQVITRTVDGKTTKVETGLITELETTGTTTDGQAPIDEIPTTEDSEYKAPLVNAASRGDVKIGKIVDDPDDSARLAIITHYASMDTVRVYDHLAPDSATRLHTRTDSDGMTSLSAGTRPGSAAGYTGGPVDLKPEGMFYRARAIPAANGDITDTDGLQPVSPSGTPLVQGGDLVGASTKPVMVYSYRDDNGHKVYVVEAERTVVPGVTEVTYQSVQTHVAVNRDGKDDTGVEQDEATAAGVTDHAAGDELVQVTAKLPGRAAYDHIHFGTWAELNDDGTDVGGLGIGFVQNIGDGMTPVADMLNHGTATYNGNWVATVQQADVDGKGAVSLEDGQATLRADFEDMDLTATLAGLATLEATITDNGFTGTTATVVDGDPFGLDSDGKFSGDTMGAFFGPKADEAGGVFSFTSNDGDNEDGAFSGAFGGAR